MRAGRLLVGGVVTPEALNEDGEAMKKLALLALFAATALLNTGCYTPAYTAQERFAMIGRNWDYEGKQIADDIDHALLLRPAGRLSIWNLR
jgi:hypothetical protein